MRRIDAPLLWRALRPFSFPLSLLPVLVGAAASGGEGGGDGKVLAAAIWGVLWLHAFGNTVNDLFDHRHGVDRRVEGDAGRPGRFLVRGELLPRHVALLAIACLVALLPAAVHLLLTRGPRVLPFGLAALLLAWVYTGPPLRLKHRGLGLPVVFLAFGPCLVLGAAVAIPPLRPSASALLLPFCLSLLVGAETTAVLVANDLRDAEEDEGAGIRTTVRLLGRGRTLGLYAALLLVPPLAVAAGVIAGGLPRACLAACASLAVHGPLLRRTVRGERLADGDARTAAGSTLFHGGLALGLALAVW